LFVDGVDNEAATVYCNGSKLIVDGVDDVAVTAYRNRNR